MANTREFLLFSDAIMSNPNGDMINDNRPRQDERTGCLEMSDVRIKRYIRDEWLNREDKVFVRPVLGKDGYLDCKGVAKKVMEEENITKDELENKLKAEYKDVKLFGAVVTEPKFNILGPLQIMWSRSVHEAEVEYTQGTSVFSSGESRQQGTIWSKYYTPYALFKTYMVYNDLVAQKQNITVTEEDIEDFKDVLIAGIRNYKSTSKNQTPRLLVEVVYNKNHIDGELDYINVKSDKQDLEIRSIEDFTFDLAPLYDYYQKHREIITSINIYKHSKVKMIQEYSEFNYYYL